MLDALQDHRLSGAIDATDRAPVAVPHPDPVLLAAEWPSCGMGCERVGGESLDPSKKGPLVARRQRREVLDRTRRNDQPHLGIIGGASPTVKLSVAVGDNSAVLTGSGPAVNLARADEVIE